MKAFIFLAFLFTFNGELSAQNKAVTVPSMTTIKKTTISGVDFLDTLKLEKKYILQGVALRSKLWFSIYVIGHYQELGRSKADIKKDPTNPKFDRLLRLVLKRNVSKNDMINALDAGIKKNTSHKIFKQITRSMNHFKNLFNDDDFKEGAEVIISYTTNSSIKIILNGKLKGTVKDANFAKAIFDVWLGKKPVTRAIKNKLLG